MSLYDKVKQGFYKDAINLIAKKVDELDESGSGGVTFTPEQISFGDTDNGESAAYWDAGANNFSFNFSHNFDYIIPVGVGCCITSKFSDCFASIIHYTLNTNYAKVYCSYFNLFEDEGIIDEPVLYYIGVMKGE